MIKQINFKLKLRLCSIDINKIKPFPGNGAKNLMRIFVSVRIVQVIKCTKVWISKPQGMALLSTEID